MICRLPLRDTIIIGAKSACLQLPACPSLHSASQSHLVLHRYGCVMPMHASMSGTPECTQGGTCNSMTSSSARCRQNGLHR